ncbi:helix-turn-helix domain-containing protein [Pseudomonas fluorescens]|uniref:helix-turn-helix domain-containing protein n=1 Tax=Pseudomonas fluorescens TaxID=294 RepID=UPI00069A2742|nr:helix-turn-helix domain-containing protein [Pseudomonas fluorescens]
MSFQAMAWAVDQTLPTREKFVLIILANYASNDTWDCYPSLTTIASNTGMSRDTVMRAIKQLETMGAVSTIRRTSDGVNLPNIYRIHKSADLRGVVAVCDQGSSTVRLGVVAESDSNLSLEPIIEPGKCADAQIPPSVQFDGTDFHVCEGLLTKWAKAFPEVNIDLEIERASVWAASNPPKKDWQRFLSNWLSKKSGGSVDETDVPVDQIIALYHKVCPNLPAVTVPGDKVLRSMIVERWNESPDHKSGQNFWLGFFQKANSRNQVFFRGQNVAPRLEALVSRAVFREISEAAQ